MNRVQCYLGRSANRPPLGIYPPSDGSTPYNRRWQQCFLLILLALFLCLTVFQLIVAYHWGKSLLAMVFTPPEFMVYRLIRLGMIWLFKRHERAIILSKSDKEEGFFVAMAKSVGEAIKYLVPDKRKEMLEKPHPRNGQSGKERGGHESNLN